MINDVEEDFDKAEKAILEKDLLLADKYLLDARGKLNAVSYTHLTLPTTERV